MTRAILLVFAHPDDESMGFAGTVLKYTRQGVAVDLVCATRGEKGARLDVPADMDTGTARETELRAAAAITGIRNIYLLGYIDGELHTADADEVMSKVVEIMRQVQPEVVITFGPDGITGHGDHVAIGRAATAAFERLTGQDGGPRKLYYATIPEGVVPNADELGIITRPGDEVTTTIDISDHFGMKIQAISAHRSQQDAREFVEMLREAREWPFAHQEFLYLANPRASGKETDLFQ
jgi:LmbE family N-acetylglucosaminyl deacetylase